MNVESILKSKGRKVATVTPNATIATIVHRLKLERIGSVVVSDAGSKVLGVIAERDIIHGLAVYGGALLEKRAAEIMSREAPTCAPADNLTKVMALMTRRRKRHLPVVEGGKLAGIVSIGDVVKHRLEDLAMEANVLRDVYLASH